MKHKTNKPHRIKSLLLALAMAFSCCAVPSDAAEKELRGGTVDVIRWHRGLPPQDGEWHRVIISNGTRFIRGNTVEKCDDYEITLLSVLESTYRFRVVGRQNWNHYEDGQFIDMPRDETKLTENGLDLSLDTFYTDTYLNTPAIRFNPKGGKTVNGYEPEFSNAPTYDIRLSDWGEGDGKLTDETIFCMPVAASSAWGEITGEFLNGVIRVYTMDLFGVYGLFTETIGHDLASLAGGTLRTTLVSKKLDITTPWAFVSHEQESDIDEGKYVIAMAADDMTGWYHNVYLEYPNSIFTCVFGLYGTWAGSQEYTIYWGETVHIDSIGVNEVIGNGTVVNLNAAGENKNYLRIAPGATLTVADGGVLSVGAGVFNEGTIKVEKGGTMIVKEGAYVGPKEYGQKLGNIVCDGGDLVIMPGAKVFLEGAAGLKLDNNAHLVNQGLIVTGNARLQSSVVENPGALYVYSAVRPDRRGEFMDWRVQLSNGGADYPGATGWGGGLLLAGQGSLTSMMGYQSVWTGNYVNAKS